MGGEQAGCSDGGGAPEGEQKAKEKEGEKGGPLDPEKRAVIAWGVGGEGVGETSSEGKSTIKNSLLWPPPGRPGNTIKPREGLLRTSS